MQDEDKPEEDRDIVYYYSRERRLNRAPRTVKELVNSSDKKRGLVKTIFGNRGNMLVFMSIIMICIMFYMSNRPGGTASPEFIIGNNQVTVTILEEDSILFLSITKIIPARANVYTGAVDIAVSPTLYDTEEPPVMSHRIFFSFNTREDYLVSLPFDGDSFIVMIQTEHETMARTIRREP